MLKEGFGLILQQDHQAAKMIHAAGK